MGKHSIRCRWCFEEVIPVYDRHVHIIIGWVDNEGTMFCMDNSWGPHDFDEDSRKWLK